MKLLELFLVETFEEDREIISLASSIASYINKSKLDFKSKDDLEYYQPITIGTIGDISDTFLNMIKSVKIQVMTDDGINEFIKKYPHILVDVDSGIPGIWAPHLNTIILNSDSIGDKSFVETIVHELRHVLDDYKSDFKASLSRKYNIPKDKSHRKVTKDPYMGNLAYTARPSEINSRFLELLNKTVSLIDIAFENVPKPNPEKVRASIIKQFMELFVESRIPEIYPKGEDSPEYRRLIRRAKDFIEKEISSREKSKKS